MLPAEIIDFIFSFLQEDRAALTACSAAHPLLSSLAERHLFVRIIIYLTGTMIESPADGFSVPDLARCLSERPYLADHIRSITIHLPRHGYGFYQLSTILPLITRSEELSLCNVRWVDLSIFLRSALLEFLRSPHMKTISLDNAAFPLELLDNFRNIKNLKIYSSPGLYLPLSLPSVESLSLINVDLYKYSRWTDPRMDNLISLHSNVHSNLSPILTACSKSLKNFTLEIGNSFQTSYHKGSHSSVIGPLTGFSFNLSSLTSLEVITVYAKISASEITEGTDETPNISYCESALLTITQLIATAGPSLKRAVLNLDCNIKVVPDLRDAVEWGALVLLCDSLSHLRVDLCIRASTPSHVRFPFFEVVDALVGNEDLSGLVERGSLVIKPFFPVTI